MNRALLHLFSLLLSIVNISYIWLDLMREPRISHCNMQANDTETPTKFKQKIDLVKLFDCTVKIIDIRCF